jgi:hypothetical protein
VKSLAKVLKKAADNRDPDSPATRLRRKRFELFLDLLTLCPDTRSLKILDVGGTQEFWDSMGFADANHTIVLLNMNASKTSRGNFVSVTGDARSMPFRDAVFDVVFSNSVIEHVGFLDQQRCMANEVQRVGQRFFIQTPNVFFPIEPHFLFPFFHWLPVAWRVFLVRRFSLGWMPREHDLNRAEELVISIRLFRKAELQSLFPDAVIWREKFWGLTKSLVAIKN